MLLRQSDGAHEVRALQVGLAKLRFPEVRLPQVELLVLPSPRPPYMDGQDCSNIGSWWLELILLGFPGGVLAHLGG
jgi:hypothetical protein